MHAYTHPNAQTLAYHPPTMNIVPGYFTYNYEIYDLILIISSEALYRHSKIYYKNVVTIIRHIYNKYNNTNPRSFS